LRAPFPRGTILFIIGIEFRVVVAAFTAEFRPVFAALTAEFRAEFAAAANVDVLSVAKSLIEFTAFVTERVVVFATEFSRPAVPVFIILFLLLG
jgi:hypothetical protein